MNVLFTNYLSDIVTPKEMNKITIQKVLHKIIFTTDINTLSAEIRDVVSEYKINTFVRIECTLSYVSRYVQSMFNKARINASIDIENNIIISFISTDKDKISNKLSEIVSIINDINDMIIEFNTTILPTKQEEYNKLNNIIEDLNYEMRL